MAYDGAEDSSSPWGSVFVIVAAGLAALVALQIVAWVVGAIAALVKLAITVAVVIAVAAAVLGVLRRS